jgi:hypothetical protein
MSSPEVGISLNPGTYTININNATKWWFYFAVQYERPNGPTTIGGGTSVAGYTANTLGTFTPGQANPALPLDDLNCWLIILPKYGDPDGVPMALWGRESSDNFQMRKQVGDPGEFTYAYDFNPPDYSHLAYFFNRTS